MSPRSTARVLSSRPDAPWLPPGGRADVVLAAPGAAPPAPICIVRLLVTRGQDLLTVVRGDGRGLDIPSVRADGSPEERLQALMAHTLGTARHANLLGYVRNVLERPTDDYPWPAPDAYFAVWHLAVPAGSEGRGRWLDVGEAREELETRHWWPLAAHMLEGQQAVRP